MHTVENLLWKGLWICRLKDGPRDDHDHYDDDDDGNDDNDNDQWCKNII
jgi:hypothetical protein